MKQHRGCLFADKPHQNFRNSIKVHGLDHTFRGCEKEAVILNQGIVDMVNLIVNSTSYDLLKLPFLLSEAVNVWLLERELYKSEKLQSYNTTGGGK